MSIRTLSAASLALFVCVQPSAARAQQTPPQQAPQGGGRPALSAHRVTEPPTIDGALDEKVWQTAATLSTFVQAEPLEGQPASEKTDVRVLYDDVAMYIGVHLFDSDPEQIVTTDTSRDAALGEQDSFQIILDTFKDHQNGFVFGTTAAGIQYDAQVR